MWAGPRSFDPFWKTFLQSYPTLDYLPPSQLCALARCSRFVGFEAIFGVIVTYVTWLPGILIGLYISRCIQPSVSYCQLYFSWCHSDIFFISFQPLNLIKARYLQTIWVYCCLTLPMLYHRLLATIFGYETLVSMKAPLMQSSSVRDFWGRRWNLIAPWQRTKRGHGTFVNE